MSIYLYACLSICIQGGASKAEYVGNKLAERGVIVVVSDKSVILKG